MGQWRTDQNADPQSSLISPWDILFKRDFWCEWPQPRKIHDKRSDLSLRWSLLVVLQTCSPLKLTKQRIDKWSCADWVDHVQWWEGDRLWAVDQGNWLLLLKRLQTKSGYLWKVLTHSALSIPLTSRWNPNQRTNQLVPNIWRWRVWYRGGQALIWRNLCLR
jgi:hypothetical protein